MASTAQAKTLVALALGAGLVSASPAAGFDLFGIHLWGAREGDDAIEIIDPLPYTVTMHVTGGEDGLEKKMQAASSLWGDRESPASGNAGLLSKARGDYRRLLAALYGEGYYGPTISIRAAGVEVADATLAAAFPSPTPVVIDITAGAPFRFGTTRIVNPPPGLVDEHEDTPTPASLGFAPGEPALSGVINQVSALAIERWRQDAHAKAREADREVIADHPARQLDVALTFDPGRAAHYGPTRVVGTRRMDPAFVAFMADLPEGKRFDPDDVQAAIDRLNRLGVFRSLRVEEADAIGPDGSLPMTVFVEDRRPRTIGFGGTLSTIDGIGVSAYWMHRNLFRHAERLRFEAGIDGLGSSLNPEDYDYNLGVNFTRPGVWTPDTSFVTGLVAQRANFDTYRVRSITGTAGISQLFGARLTGELFAQISRARYDDDFGIRHFTTFGLVGRGAYDDRNDPLDATRGYYVAVEAQPFYEAEYGNTALRGTLEGRAYHGFGAEDRVVLAGRAKIGTYLGPDAAESPPDLLFFAGGGGSVRGYEYRSIGVGTMVTSNGETSDTFIVGGSGLVETSVELRYHFAEKYGAVGFVDTGYVTENSNFSGSSDFQVGAGLGFRYYTGIGVLRADLATPVNPRPQDSPVALYIGIGQAF